MTVIHACVGFGQSPLHLSANWFQKMKGSVFIALSSSPDVQHVAHATCTHALDYRWSITLVPLVRLLTRQIKLKNDARGCALHYSWMRLQMFSASWFLFIVRGFGHGSNPGREDEWIRTGAAKAMTSWQSVTGSGLKVLPHTWCAHTTASLAAKKMSKLVLSAAV